MILGNTANLCPELFKVLVNLAVRAHIRDKRCDLLLKGRFARRRRERLHYSFAGRVVNQKSLVRIPHSQNSVSLVGGHVIPTLYAKLYYVGYPTDDLRRSAQS